MEHDMKTFLKSHPNLIINENEDGKCKVVCQLTSHEMPCTRKAVEMYINGKKYKYACEHKLTSEEKELCSQYLIEKRGQLFCKLTNRYLNNLPHHIRQHLNGRRLQKALKNLESTNADKGEPKHQEKMEDDKDTELWIPPDSESESEETEQLDAEFKEKEEIVDEEDHDYSFDVLNVEETPLQQDDKKELSNRKDKAKKAKTKLKRLTDASAEKSKKKGKKSQRNTAETPKKKRKKQER